MKKVLKVVGIIFIIIIVLILLLVIKFIKDQKIQTEDQEAMIKTDEELIGKHLYIKMEGKEDIDVNFYTTGAEKIYHWL